jgi:hypothetical protein
MAITYTVQIYMPDLIIPDPQHCLVKMTDKQVLNKKNFERKNMKTFF